MYVEISMIAAKNGCCDATVRRIVREMEESGSYPTAVRRCGITKVDADAFEHYIQRRKRKRGKHEKNVE